MRLTIVGNTGYGNKRDIVKEISERVPRHIQLDELKKTFPLGKVVRNEFIVGSLEGEQGESLKINIDMNSPHFMQGTDFATGEGVGGITKIMMRGRRMSLKEVEEHFEYYLEKPKAPIIENPIKPNFLNNPPPVQETVSTKEFDKPKEKKIDINGAHDGEYLYLSEDGEILFTVRRFNKRDENGEVLRGDDGKPKKEFRQIPPLGEKTRPLYNLPDISNNNRIIFVEGEKCADALTKVGFTATCTIGGGGMLSENSKSKYDFSPLEGKDVIIWPDNDKKGQEYADFVETLLKEANVKSVSQLRVPHGTPEKWDAYDAIEDGLDIGKFIKKYTKQARKSFSLLSEHLLINNQFEGKAPEQQYLIGDTIPLGVPVVFAAAGDSGKGMMTLDLAMKVASGMGMQNAFGGIVSHHGSAIILSAEDDRDELHRRVARLDPLNRRKTYEHKLIVVPMPNEGGVVPIMQKVDNKYVMNEEFEKIWDDMKEIDDLALVVIDPMASFVHADVNADPAAGAAFMGMLAQLSTETGATVMVNHHMAKVNTKEAIKTPEEARVAIRGTSAIVDGVRSAFALWQVEEKEAKSRCQAVNVPFSRNAVFDGAVVKSNGPANRNIRKFIRNPETGLLEDRTDNLKESAQISSTMRRQEYLLNFIRRMEEEGRYFTHGGKEDGLHVAIEDAPHMDIDAANLKGTSQETIVKTVRSMLNDGVLGKYGKTRNAIKKYLGVVGGRLHMQNEEWNDAD